MPPARPYVKGETLGLRVVRTRFSGRFVACGTLDDLGGNKRKLRNFDGHLTLLKDLATYRTQALAHVVAALQTLRGMREDMEDMRERAAAPDLIGSSVPPEVHMKSIEMGLKRLKEGRSRAKKRPSSEGCP